MAFASEPSVALKCQISAVYFVDEMQHGVQRPVLSYWKGVAVSFAQQTALLFARLVLSPHLLVTIPWCKAVIIVMYM